MAQSELCFEHVPGMVKEFSGKTCLGAIIFLAATFVRLGRYARAVLALMMLVANVGTIVINDGGLLGDFILGKVCLRCTNRFYFVCFCMFLLGKPKVPTKNAALACVMRIRYLVHATHLTDEQQEHTLGILLINLIVLVSRLRCFFLPLFDWTAFCLHVERKLGSWMLLSAETHPWRRGVAGIGGVFFLPTAQEFTLWMTRQLGLARMI